MGASAFGTGEVLLQAGDCSIDHPVISVISQRILTGIK